LLRFARNDALKPHHLKDIPMTEPYDDMPEDMDAFRDVLARRTELLLEARGHEIPDPPSAAAAAGDTAPEAR
jgi:hypothetical protein